MIDIILDNIMKIGLTVVLAGISILCAGACYFVWE